MVLIDNLLDKAKITSLSSLKEVGTTHEAHLAELNGKKYLLRICKDEKTAVKYKRIYKRFQRYGFFPKLIASKGQYLVFEFILGRICNKNESEKTIFQIGRIVAIINKVNAKYDFENGFLDKLNSIKSFKILSSKKISEIKDYYKKHIKKAKLETALDASDVTNDNFIFYKGKIYFVDIEAIKPNIKGFGIAKSFLDWFKKPSEQKTFEKGYNSISSMRFFNKEYKNLCSVIFLIHRINFKYKKGDCSLVKISIKKLNKILKNDA